MTTKKSMMVAVVVGVAWAAAASAALTPAQKCEKAKNRAAGKYGLCVAAQRGKAIGGGAPDFGGCAHKLLDAFASAEQKAIDAASACLTSGDAMAVLDRTRGVFDSDNALPKWFSNTRFFDNGNGTVSDTLTGLMWEKKTSDFSIHDTNNTYVWSSSSPPNGNVFTTFLATLNNCTSDNGTALIGGFAGYCDWRLPTNAELQTILLTPYPCGTVPCIDQTAFGPTDNERYWSSTTQETDPSFAWVVDFGSGTLTQYPKNTNLPVRAVRGGQ